MNGHHLILGRLTDFLTGETLDDTHDERYRQKLARLLVHKKGYAKDEIKPRSDLHVKVDGKQAILKVDFQITLSHKVRMLIQYGPGSLVTRRRPALAAARVLTPYQIPVVVVTNGQDAEILTGTDGTVVANGLASIPSRDQLLSQTATGDFAPVSSRRAKIEARIIYAYEVDGRCPCDDTICCL